jgi:class 3 adenylate cyclase
VVVTFTPGAPSLAALIEEAWGTGAMVFFTSDEPFPAAYRRALLRAGVDPERASTRYWVPAALRAALDGGEAAYFEGVRAWLVESPDGRSLTRYALSEGRVTRAELPLG